MLSCLLARLSNSLCVWKSGKVLGLQPLSSRRIAQELFSSRPPPLDYASHTRPRTPAQAQIHTHTLHPRTRISRRLAGATFSPRARAPAQAHLVTVQARLTSHTHGFPLHTAGSAPTPWATARYWRPGSLPSPLHTVRSKATISHGCRVEGRGR